MHANISPRIRKFPVFLLLLLIFTSSFGQNVPVQGMQVDSRNFTTFSERKSSATDALWKQYNAPSDYDHPEFGVLPPNAPCSECVEVYSKRTVDSRYFINTANPTEFYQQNALGDLNILQNGDYLTIDHRLHPAGNQVFESGLTFEQAGIDAGNGRTYIKTVSGTVYFNRWKLFTRTGTTETEIAQANWSDYTVGSDGMLVRNIFPGIDAEIMVFRGSLKTNFIIRENLMGAFSELVFRDEFTGPAVASLQFQNSPGATEGAGSLVLKSGALEVLSIGENVLLARGGPKELSRTGSYRLSGNQLDVVVPFEWISENIGSYELIVDPVVTGSATLAQASITGSRYNASCNFTNSCDYTLAVPRPANATITNVAWTFSYLATGSCWLEDGGIKIGVGSCISPAANGYYWFCNSIGGGTCTGTNQTIYSDVASCIPAPGCTAQNVTFTLKFYRSCWGATGCSNNCIGAASPWTMTITGNTVQHSNTANPITLSATTVCAGGTLTASTSGSGGVPPYTYNWSFSPTGTPSIATGASATITFPTSGTVTLYSTITDACGNIVSASRTVTVTPGPTVTISPSPASICAGGSVSLTASGATTYSWSPATGLSATTGATVTASPASSTTYTVTGTTSGCSSSTSVAVTVNPLPVVSVTPNPAAVCSGGSVTLTASGAASYAWSPGTGLSSTSGASVSASPTASTTYTVTGTSASGCVASTTVPVTVNANPVVTVNSATICAGATATLNASGATTYSWSPASGLSSTTGASVTANPTATTTYTVTGTDANGCLATANSTVTVNPLPVISVTPSAPSICTGTSVTLTASGATTYSWSPGTGLSATTGATVTANPAATTTYTVTGTSGSGCSASTNVTVTVNSLPTIIVNSPTICAGSSATLNAGGASAYSWSPAAGLSSTTGASVTANPTATTTYTVTGTDANGCINTANSTVTVNSLPVISVNSPTICSGSSATLNASGAATYSWSPGTGLSSTTGASVTANPTATTTYTVTGTDANGCLATANSTVTVNPLPVISVTPSASSVCTGSSVSLTASGATTYSWSPGTGLSATTGATVTANPTTTTTYTVTGTSGSGCSASTNVTVTVNPLPTITVNSPTICTGSSATLNAGGASAYSWSPAAGLSSTTGASVTANPTATTTYTVTGTDANGCVATANSTVTVNPLPVISVTPSTPAICSGGSVTLSASGATTYSWSPGTGLSATTGASVTASPTATTTYTVTGTQNGCSATQNVTVTVNANPVISVSPSAPAICTGSSVSLTASGATTYSWSPAAGLSSATGASVTANPAATTTYTVTGTSGSGCSASTSVTVTVSPLPTITVNSPAICAGSSATLNASGASTYSWSPAAGLSSTTGASVTANPTATTTYTVTGTNANGCVATASSTVTVNPLPVISVTPSAPAICPGGSVTLSASGATTYSWSPATGLSATTGASVTASPTATTTYTVTGTQNGCSATQNVTVTVNANPVITVNSPSICEGATATLVAGGAGASGTYSWSPAGGLSSPTGSPVTASPAVTTSYIVTGTNANGCSGSATSTITVKPLPVVSATNNGPLCPGDQLLLDATSTSGSAFSWSGPQSFTSTAEDPSIASISSANAGNYVVTATLNGCTANATTTLVMNPVISTAITPAGPFCANDAVQMLTAANPGGVWSGSGISNPNTGAFDPSAAAIGSNTVTYQIPGTCSETSTATIIVNALPQISFTADKTSGCPDLPVQFTNTSGTQGTFSWTFGDQSSSSEQNPLHIYSSAGCFDVTLELTDASGCTSQSTIADFICLSPTPVAAFSASDYTTTTVYPVFEFFNQSTGATAYTWEFGDGSMSSATSPEHIYPEVPGSYTVWLFVQNADGCADSTSRTVQITEELLFFIPNVFTPNGDEHNNTFQPVFTSGFDPYSFTLLIYNRWGETIFESHDPLVGWDGTYNGTLQMEGTYTWTVKFRSDQSDKKYTKAGSVLLVK